MRKKMNELTFCVVGVGQIGGSFVLALRENHIGKHITGVDREDVIRRLKTKGMVDLATTQLEKSVEKADFIFLSTPVLDILELLPRIARYMKPEAVLLDSGSTKKEILRLMQEFPHRILIGGHPMAGREKAGYEAATSFLFKEKTFALTFPTEKSLEGKNTVIKILKKIGAVPLEIDAERHDWIVSMTSHLPYVLSLALSSLAEDLMRTDSLYQEFTASGFLGLTRLSLTDEKIGLGMLSTNSFQITAVIDEFQEKLNRIKSLLEKGSGQRLMKFLISTRNFQSHITKRKDESLY